jgi:hypothetical protein
MMNQFASAGLFLLFTLLVSCGKNPEQRIVGDWQLALMQSANPLPDFSEQDFQFSFTADGTYAYVGNLNFREAGTYRIEPPYLFTIDTLRSGTEEKAVLMEKLTRDSLVLLMAGETQMRLARVKKD